MTRAERLRRTAIHEAGHAVVAHVLGVRLHRVTIRKCQEYLGQVRHGPSFSERQWHALDDHALARLGRNIKIAYAGALAVKRAYPRSRWRSAERDFNVAADIILRVYPDSKMQWHWSSLLFLETEALLAWHWLDVEALAERLLAHETLTGKEAKQVIYDAVRARSGFSVGNRNGGNASE